MRGWPLVLVAGLVAAALAAGCTDRDGGIGAAGAALPAPSHFAGDHWRYETEGNDWRPEAGLPADAGDGFTMIVRGARAGGLATDRCQIAHGPDAALPLAAWAATFDGDTDPEGPSGPRLLAFPLVEGKQWEFEARGAHHLATVSRVTAGGQAEIVVVDEHGLSTFVAHYDAQVGWLSFLRDVHASVTYRIAAHGAAYAGEVCELARAELLAHEAQDGVEDLPVEVPAGDVVVARLEASARLPFPGGAASFRLEAKSPGASRHEVLYEHMTLCPVGECASSDAWVDVLPVEAGLWEWRVTSHRYMAHLHLELLDFETRDFQAA